MEPQTDERRGVTDGGTVNTSATPANRLTQIRGTVSDPVFQPEEKYASRAGPLQKMFQALAKANDAGSAGGLKAVKDARRAPPNPPKLELLSFDRPTKGLDGKCEYHIGTKSFTFDFLGLSTSAKAKVLDKEKERGSVTFGFIQNLLSLHVEAQYSGRKPEVWNSPSRSWLDSAPGHLPWIGEGITETSMDYKPGVQAQIKYEDYPKAGYRYYYNDKQENGELLRIRETLEFALWVCARMTDDDPQDLRAYQILSGIRFKYLTDLNVTKTVSAFIKEAKAKGKEVYTYTVQPAFTFKADLEYSSDLRGITPLLKGPIANEALQPPLIPKEIFAPMFPNKP